MTRLSPPAEVLPEPLQVVARTPGAVGGHDFAMLLTEVAGETNFQPGLVNPTSGAAGPFQFIRSTWLGLVRDYGASMGIKPELVKQISLDAKGRPRVADARSLEDLLALRHDPVLATKMAGKYLDLSTAQLKHALGRDPSETEIHLAFLLGPAGAAHLLHVAQSAPATPVDQVVGAAASANKTLFLEADGTPRTAADAVTFLAGRYEATKARTARYVRAMPTPPNAKIDA
jgi:hypothetical protein